MKPQIESVDSWLATASPDDVVACPTSSVPEQLVQLDTNGTGFGYVYFLTPIIRNDITNGDSSPDKEELHMTFKAVFKLSGKWYIAIDDNISDIACAVVRMIVETIKPDA